MQRRMKERIRDNLRAKRQRIVDEKREKTGKTGKYNREERTELIGDKHDRKKQAKRDKHITGDTLTEPTTTGSKMLKREKLAKKAKASAVGKKLSTVKKSGSTFVNSLKRGMF
jgi:hypothetical protein